MALMEFFGCMFVAFGAPFSMFLFTIARDPLRIIVLMASAFFWLVGLLLSSILWYAVVPLRDQLAFGLVFSVIIQEIFRFLFYKLLRKADEGLQKVSEQDPSSSGVTLVNNKHVLAYVSGLGFGIISGAFSLINVLAEMVGPGTVGIHGASEDFFITSAFLTLCFTLLHVCWGVVFHAACDKRNYLAIGAVVSSHMLVSCLTLLNQSNPPIYLASLLPAYLMLVVVTAWAFITAGGSLENIKQCVKCQQIASYQTN